MGAMIFGFAAASLGAMCGLFVAAMLASAKLRDLEMAYCRLSEPVRAFLQTHPAANGIMPTTPQELVALKSAIDVADALACSRGSGSDRR